jgi:hypothetical protein
MNCPRCGSPTCTNPDEKECSDNCITRHYATINRLEGELAAGQKSQRALIEHMAAVGRWGKDEKITAESVYRILMAIQDGKSP